MADQTKLSAHLESLALKLGTVACIAGDAKGARAAVLLQTAAELLKAPQTAAPMKRVDVWGRSLN